MRRTLFVTALALFLSAGCARRQQFGTLSTGGYTHPKQDYRIEPGEGVRGDIPLLLPAHWTIDNYFRDSRGRLVRKDEREEIWFDIDGDGKRDTRRKVQVVGPEGPGSSSEGVEPSIDDESDPSLDSGGTEEDETEDTSEEERSDDERQSEDEPAARGEDESGDVRASTQRPTKAPSPKRTKVSSEE